MKSKLEQSVELLGRQPSPLRCPICKGGMKVGRFQSLYCKKSHSFDISKKGTVNLAPGARPSDYDKRLFASRGRILSQGFYDPVADALADLAVSHCRGRTGCAVLDAGCGEGFYLSRLRLDERLPESCLCFGVDLSKDAVAAAARRPAPVGWCVADLADLPFGDGSFDVVLDVLTPANYREFARVLKPDGVLVKVVPGDGYLKEIRALLSEQLINKRYSNQSVVDYTRENLDISETRELRYTLPLTPGQAADFLLMTPMTAKAEALPAPGALSEITIDLVVMAGRPKGGGKKKKKRE